MLKIPSAPDRMRTLTVQVSDSSYQILARDAKARGVLPANIAEAAIEDHARRAMMLDRRFRDAAAEVDRRLANAPA
jgi:hypothetical protein